MKNAISIYRRKIGYEDITKSLQKQLSYYTKKGCLCTFDFNDDGDALYTNYLKFNNLCLNLDDVPLFINYLQNLIREVDDD